MSDYPAQHSDWSWKKPVIIVCLGLLGLIMVIVTFECIGASALSRAIAEGLAIGGPVTLQQMEAVRPAYPADKNGANMILAIQPKLDATSKSLDKLRGPAVDDLPVFGPNPDPVRGERWNSSQLARAEKFLAGFEQELRSLEELKSCPGGRFSVEIPADPILIDRPYLATIRFAVKLKGLQMLNRAMRGDASHLADDVGVMLRTAALVEGDTGVVPSLVDVACRAYAVDTLKKAFAVADVGVDQIEQLQALLANYDPYPRMQWAVRSERAIFIAGADSVRTSNPPIMRALFALDEARGITCLNRVLAQSDVRGMIAQNKVVEQEVAGNPLTLVLQLRFPSYGRALVLHLKGAADIRSAELAMAVERYRLAKGNWPPRLDDLVPNYIKSIPEDPFVPGQPLRMALQGDRLVVYSVDEDQKDDGGREWDGKTESGDTGFVLLGPVARSPSPADQ